LDVFVAGVKGLVQYKNINGLGDFERVVIWDNSVFLEARYLYFIDVDVDGMLDIVVEGLGSNDPSISWSRNLGGSFSTQKEAFPGVLLVDSQIKFDDTDGDGDQDVIMVRPNGFYSAVVHAENLGGAQFGTPTILAQIQDNAMLMLFDMDNDSDLDIAGSYNAGQGAETQIFRNQGGLNYILTSTLIQTFYSGRQFVFSADIDADGVEDLVERAYGLMGPCQWRRSLANGTFDPPVALPTFVDEVVHLDHIDINGDGLKDLVALSENNIEAAFGQGAGVFSAAVRLTRENSWPLYHQVFTDLNGDGQNELLVCESSGQVRQYQVQGDGTLMLSHFLDDQLIGAFDHLRLADVNGDGWPDAIRSLYGEGIVLVYPSFGLQGFGPSHIVASTDTTFMAEMELVDVDYDGDLDLFVLSDSLYLFTNQGNLIFEETFSFHNSQIHSGSEIECFDFDSDGDIDILLAGLSSIRRFRNDGANTFTAMSTPNGHPLNFRADKMQLADLDGDGAMDLICQDYYLNGITRWVRNSGGMNFGPSYTIGGSFVTEVKDMDMDGDLDVFSTSSTPAASWCEATGPGVFSAPHTINMAGVQACIPRLADVDNDGDPDLVLLQQNAVGSVKLNDGSGNFGAVQPLLSMDGIVDFAAEARFVDMDLDGDLDIVHNVDDLNPDMPMVGWRENFIADPYLLSGIVFSDSNGNGAFDTGEEGMAGAAVNVSPTGYLAFGSGTGEYTIHCNDGSLIVAATMINPFWEQTTMPLEYTVAPSDLQPIWTGLDFGFQPIVDTSLIHPEVVLASAPCSDTASLWITAMNEGTRIEDGTIVLMLDGAFAFLSSSPAPASINGDTITWTFNDLAYFTAQVIHASVIMPDAQAIGDLYTHAVSVTTLDAQSDTSGSFSAQLTDVVSCAYDPNDKLVSPQGYGAYGAVDLSTAYLDYTIRFQNTGNAPAQDVVLRDHIDPQLDATSLRVLGYSHVPTEVTVESGSELVVRFIGIQLPDSGSSFTESQGFIKFRIEFHPGLPHLAQAPNTAEIYFDLNELVQTNTTLTTLVDCDLWEPTITAVAIGLLEATAGDQYQWYLNGTLLPGENEQTHWATALGDYSAVVTSVYGCEVSTPPYTVTTLGLEERNRMALALVPNPFSVEARLYLDAPLNSDLRADIMDIHGRIMRSIPGTGSEVISIERGSLASGVYLVVIRETDRVLRSVRMVVQ